MTTARNFGLLGYRGPAAVLILRAPPASGACSARETGGTYMNPVSNGSADTFADPSIIKARDGYWHAYGTSDPPRGGEKRTHVIPMILALQV